MIRALEETRFTFGLTVLPLGGSAAPAYPSRPPAGRSSGRRTAPRGQEVPARRAERRNRSVAVAREELGHRARQIRARLIRDQRYASALVRRRVSRVLRTLALGLVLGVGVSAAVARESGLSSRYAELPAAEGTDLEALRLRRSSIAELVAGNPLWLGSIRASHETSLLDTRIASLERQQAAAAVSAEFELLRRQDLAETARLHGRSYVEARRFAPALEQFRLALWSAPPSWPALPRTKADVAALEEWLARRKPAAAKAAP